MKPVLQLLQPVYYKMQSIRNKMYDKGILESVKTKIPVISVGNISFGGTGKTPFVQWICHLDVLKDKKIAILSKAYKAEFSGEIYKVGEKEMQMPEVFGDEACMLASSLPKVDVYVCGSKSQAAQIIDEKYDYDLLLVDDAFQHRRLERDLDIVLLDASVSKLRYQRFPKGDLREDLLGLQRADYFVFTKAESPSPSLRDYLSTQFEILKTNMVMGYELGKPTRITPTGSVEFIESKEPDYILVTGVGNPKQVEMSFEKLFGKAKAKFVFKDHYAYTKKDIELFQYALEKNTAKYLFCTEKDYLKIKKRMKNASSLYYIPIRNQPLEGEVDLVEKISSLFS